MSSSPSSNRSNTPASQQASGTPGPSTSSTPAVQSWQSTILIETEINGDEDFDSMIEYLDSRISAKEVERDFNVFQESDLGRALTTAVEEIQSLESAIRSEVLEAHSRGLNIEVDNFSILGSQGNAWRSATVENVGRPGRDKKCDGLKAARKDIKFLRKELLKLQELVYKRRSEVSRGEVLSRHRYPAKSSRPAVKVDFRPGS